MKKLQKNKILHITERKLHNIIINEVKKLYEHADERKNIIQKISNHFSQIIENWILVHYCTITNENINNCKNHWRNELFAQLAQCSSYHLKGNDSYQARLKTYIQAEKKEEQLTREDVILKHILPKFNKENINIRNNENITNCVNDLMNEKDNIISLIANGDVNQIIDYTNRI